MFLFNPIPVDTDDNGIYLNTSYVSIQSLILQHLLPLRSPSIPIFSIYLFNCYQPQHSYMFCAFPIRFFQHFLSFSIHAPGNSKNIIAALTIFTKSTVLLFLSSFLLMFLHQINLNLKLL